MVLLEQLLGAGIFGLFTAFLTQYYNNLQNKRKTQLLLKEYELTQDSQDITKVETLLDRYDEFHKEQLSFEQYKSTRYSERIAELTKKNKELIKQVFELEADNSLMLEVIRFLSIDTKSLSMPCWIVTIEGKVIDYNKAFDNVFIKPNGYETNYNSKTHLEFWKGSNIWEAFVNSDKLIKESKQYTLSHKVTGIDNSLSSWVFIRFKLATNKEVTGYGGLAFKSDSILNL